VRQIENDRHGRSHRSTIPESLRLFIDDIAQLFQPFRGMGRVGFECCQAEGAWEISMFLGETEAVGGPIDGRLIAPNFNFDLLAIQERFDQLDQLKWNAFPDHGLAFDEEPTTITFLLADGLVDGERVRMQIHASPPTSVGPAMKQFADGTIELV
jgi:hypothetical protein